MPKINMLRFNIVPRHAKTSNHTFGLCKTLATDNYQVKINLYNNKIQSDTCKT